MGFFHGGGAKGLSVIFFWGGGDREGGNQGGKCPLLKVIGLVRS